MTTASSGKAGVSKVSHLLLQVSDLDRALRFYVEFLGFTVRESSTLKDGRDFHATVEGLGLTTLPDAQPPASSFDHLAFRCPDGIERLKTMLDQAGISYEARRSPYGNSVYFRDPDGYLLELHDSTGV